MNRTADAPEQTERHDDIVVLSEAAAAKMVAACVDAVFGVATNQSDPDLPLLRQAFLDLNKLMYTEGVSWQLAVPESTPGWIDEDLLVETVAIMSPRYGKPVLGRPSVEMIERVGRLADVLQGGAS